MSRHITRSHHNGKPVLVVAGYDRPLRELFLNVILEASDSRPRFRGKRIKEDLASYARLLVDAGLVLGVCDWGFCVYREEHSACLSNAAGPNPARREPSTCARCQNFAVSEQHRPYWEDQVRRCEGLLDETALPLQTLSIVRGRLDQARSLVRAIDSGRKKRS